MKMKFREYSRESSDKSKCIAEILLDEMNLYYRDTYY